MQHSNFHVHKPGYFGILADDGNGSRVFGYDTKKTNNAKIIHFDKAGSGLYGYVHTGSIEMLCDGSSYKVQAGHWFSTAGNADIFIEAQTQVMIIEVDNHYGFTSLGKVGAEGRLNYIDGAKDTVLQSPIRFGMPCINALYIPAGVHQTAHTHPSTRIGFINGGSAICRTGETDHLMEAGDIFFLPADGLHQFLTDQFEGSTLNVIAFHPDSDFGPKDERHPMLNRTIVDGVSASEIESIRTK